MRTWIRTGLLTLGLMVAAAGCGGGDGGNGGANGSPIVVGLAGAPFEVLGNGGEVFLLQGSGLSQAGSMAQVRFTAASGTPFAAGTSATATVNASIVSDIEVLGVTPSATGASFQATAELVLGSGTVLPVPGTIEFVAFLFAVIDDVYIGGAGPDAFFGGPGDDAIEGRGGNDTLGGGDDSDFIAGNDGNDDVSGGSGPDIFAFEPLPGTFDDIVQDFSAAEDVLALIDVPADVGSLGGIASVTDTGAGGDVVLNWTGGGRVTFLGLGTGTRTSLVALITTGISIRIIP